MPKVLVACPTADVKEYCFPEWLATILNLTYSEYDIYICDNSENRDFYQKYKHLFKGKVIFERVTPSHFKSFRHALAKSHNKCREYAIDNGYDYLLHLESDVFPPLDVIERLLDHNKRLVGGLYHIDLGEQSKLMVQQLEDSGFAHRETYNLDEADISFVDGTVKRVFSCGLGCVLIHRKILEKVPFRYVDGAAVHPDSFFYGDLDQAKIKVFVDTSVYCRHENKAMTRI